MDENGIPDTVEGRFKIAEKIVKECEKYGIKKQDIYFDTLVLTISTNPSGAKITLDTIRKIKKELGTRTVLGLSNISFGLPGRPIINSNFLAMAIEAGLDVAITNPNNEILRNSFYSSALLCGNDLGAEKYIDSFYETDIKEARKAESVVVDLKEAIVRGFKARALELISEELKSKDELEIINSIIIPALDVVGDRYEKGVYFLPQLLLSAETAQIVSKKIQENMTKTGKKLFDNSSRTIVFATVKGDLHDIGKNIVISVLENYGYKVIDLGKGISVDLIIKSAVENNAKVIALSALMTTTMTEMKKLILSLNDQGLRNKFKVFIGGAVVNQEYADKITADAYCKDAMDTVNCLRKFGV
jgi:5-methyltetrahydrofolate--homocysteine methyltransferase